MKTENEYATELFKKYYCMSNNSKSKVKVIEFETARKCAIIDVENTIEALPYGFYSGKFRVIDHEYYQTVLQILKDKL